jgi:hypothetical protein
VLILCEVEAPTAATGVQETHVPCLGYALQRSSSRHACQRLQDTQTISMDVSSCSMPFCA